MSRRHSLREATAGLAPARRPPAPRKRDRVGPPIPGLKADVEHLAQHLREEYVEKQKEDPARVFRQACKHLRSLLMPHKRRGPMWHPDITLAREMLRTRKGEKERGGKIRKANWFPIFIAAIPGYATLSGEDRKKAERRLQCAVYNRIRAESRPDRRRRPRSRKSNDLAAKYPKPDQCPSSGRAGGSVS